MADYGHELRFGVMLQPGADGSWGRDVLALAELAEREGLDLVSLPDHPVGAENLCNPGRCPEGRGSLHPVSGGWKAGHGMG